MWGATIRCFLQKQQFPIISIHAPRVGRDNQRLEHEGREWLFQSTRPVWGATLLIVLAVQIRSHFNPRAPCGARQHTLYHLPAARTISIHAPRVGRDQVVFLFFLHPPLFQSTRPVWGATPAMPCRLTAAEISIHAPRVGRDRISLFHRCRRYYFNPRAPCGARLWGGNSCPFFILYFNPRAPCGARL